MSLIEKACDMCGSTDIIRIEETPYEHLDNSYFTCEEHAHIPPVFRMDVRESAG